MRKEEFDLLYNRLDRYRYTSMEYCEFEEVKEYDVVCNTHSLLLIRGFHTEAKALEYHWASNQAGNIIRNIKESSCFITFVPHEWIPEFEAAGYSIRNAWHDYFLDSLEAVTNEADSGELLGVEECEAASAVTMSCRGQSRGFTGQTAGWIKDWLTGADTTVKNQAVFIQRNELGEVEGLVCAGTYNHEDEKGATVWIREAAVLPQYQNQGIARKLITQALSYGKKHGAGRGFLAADECNKNAIHLYTSIGFRPGPEESQIDMIRGS